MDAMHRRQAVFALGIALVVGGGCQLPRHQPAAAATKREQIRIDCYSLLHDLLDQQKNVDKLLLVKLESDELNHLIKTIAAASAAGARALERFAAQDGSFNLKQLSLPLGEIETRSAIASTKSRQLLTSAGVNFELKLLLTQAEALSYAWHLSKVAAAHESHPERVHHLTALSDEMKDLHRQTVSLMRSRLIASRPRTDS